MEVGENLFVLAALMWNEWDGVWSWHLFCRQDEGHDEAVETQHFSEDQNQDHPHEKPRLLGGASHAGVAHNADGEPSCQTTEAHAQTSTEMQETPDGREKGVQSQHEEKQLNVSAELKTRTKDKQMKVIQLPCKCKNDRLRGSSYL